MNLAHYSIIIAPGAIVVEWNIHSNDKGGAGMWDTHFRYVVMFLFVRRFGS